MKDHQGFWTPWSVCYGIALGFTLIMCTITYFFCESPECNHNFLMVKIITQLFIASTAIAYAIFNFTDYVSLNKVNDDSVRMKFNHFKDIYYVNPDRWYMRQCRLYYKYDTQHYYHCYYVTFSYLDWLKFLVWKKRKDYNDKINLKKEEQEQHDIRMAQMLKCVQKDINETYYKIKKMDNVNEEKFKW